MIRYNFDRVFKARAVDHPTAFLRRAGLSDNFSNNIRHNRVFRLSLKHIEILCLSLHCTPNDFMEWIPDKNVDVNEEHPLNMIRPPEVEVNLTKTLNSIPLGKLEKIERLIKEELSKMKSGS